ncbi:putative reverse transcriptase domain-containing protein, partial [Tanacetum coccineum]
MIRSSTNELFTPYKEPEREFRSSRRHFKTLSLDELRSPDFNLLSDQEYSEEEVAETMAETMEQYMSKTRADYGSGVARPKIKDKDNFELKGQFLKELRTNTFSGSDHEDANEHIEKILDSRGAIPSKTAADAKVKKLLQNERGFGSLPSSTKANLRDQVKSISTTIEVDSWLIRRIGSSQYAERRDHMDHNSRKLTLKLHISMNPYPKRASVSVIPLLTYLNLGLGELAHTKLIVELVDRTVKYPKGIAENVLVRIGKFTFPIDFIILDTPEDIKVPLILGRLFLSTARAKVDVYKRKITLRLDLEARLMGETLVINRSLDPLNGDYIELNDLNEPFELRINQGNDLIPTIEEGDVIEEFRTRDEDLDTGIDDYP